MHGTGLMFEAENKSTPWAKTEFSRNATNANLVTDFGSGRAIRYDTILLYFKQPL